MPTVPHADPRRRPRRRAALLSTLLFGLALLAGPAGAETPRVHVYNWYDYIGPEVVAAFEAETGIEVVYDVFDAAEVLETKLLTGHTGYDVVVPSTSNAPQLMAAGALQPVDPARLANYGNLDPEILARLDRLPGGRTLGVPYTWVTIGVSYNVDLVEARLDALPDNALDLIFDSAHTARLKDCGIAILDAPRDVLGLALIYLGLDPYSGAAEDLAQAEALLAKVRGDILHFGSGRIISDLANGDICAAITWNGDAGIASLRAEEAGRDTHLVYRIPTSGSLMIVDLMAIAADAPHVEAAYTFLDYMLRPEVIAETTNFLYFANANRAALPHVLDEIKADPDIYPPPAIMDRLVPDLPLSQDVLRARSRLWTRVKSGL
ncbi:extracellular solute-binding protein [Roseospirillum parvum]|uniref:Putrescine-binding periplasmic protein n=1 Tax=Roseospirillum parvum TaxID=83401 RepID=A0A1G8CUI0_9PROT|nr:extracellular solute-binding protein [Roseospirillum parvum]SDH49146.1 putrescine transport system substrate-binding protein [Roseospirillum parvum]